MRVKYLFSSRKTKRATKSEKMRKQKEKYPSMAKQIIEQSDIILQILDARFISEMRNFELEKEIKKQNKKIIYVLNKSDLVEKIKKKDLIGLHPYISVSCKLRKNIRTLRNLIKIGSRKINKDKITVGVIGYPNTGKSSLINILIGKSSAGTGAEAGFTKGIQKLKLTPGIILLDTPGVIPEKEYSNVQDEKIARHVILGGRSYSQVKNPELVVGMIMKEYMGLLEEHYKINAKGDSEILLEELGKKKGLLKKRGEVDTDKTARFVLREWQEGVIGV